MKNQNFELPTFNRPESPTRRLLEETKLSKLPPIPRRAPCANCGNRLDPNDEYQTAVGFCKTCLKTYAVVGVGVEKYAESKIRLNYLEAK